MVCSLMAQPRPLGLFSQFATIHSAKSCQNLARNIQESDPHHSKAATYAGAIARPGSPPLTADRSLFASAFDLAPQPGPRIDPQTTRRARGNAQRLRRLGKRQPGEIT